MEAQYSETPVSVLELTRGNLLEYMNHVHCLQHGT